MWILVRSRFVKVRAVVIVATMMVAVGAGASLEVRKPQPKLPERYTIEGQLTRGARDLECWVTLGYRDAAIFLCAFLQTFLSAVMRSQRPLTASEMPAVATAAPVEMTASASLSCNTGFASVPPSRM